MISGSALAHAFRQMAQGGVVTIGAFNDASFMQASQTFPMSVDMPTLSWVGPASPSASWQDPNTGIVQGNALYCWRWRFWVQTAPSVGGLKILPIVYNVGMTVAVPYNVDDLNTFSANRPTFWLPLAYGPNDGNLAAPAIHVKMSATDATGILKYDMAVFRLVY